MTRNCTIKISIILGFFLGAFLSTVWGQERKPMTLIPIEKRGGSGKFKNDNPHLHQAYLNFITTREGQLRPQYRPAYKFHALQKARRISSKRRQAFDDLDWVERGPGNVGGRTRGILVMPQDPTQMTWLAGSVGGGVWKTQNGGQNWTLVSEELPNLSTSTLAFSSSNPDRVYVGTGEGFFSRAIVGEGMWKSEDAGETWAPITGTQNDERFGSILRIVVDPADENTLLIATRGSYRNLEDTTETTPVSHILKSEDGGDSWREVYTVLGSLQDVRGPAIQQLVATPREFSTLYASVRGIGVLKSLNAGESWELVFDAKGDTTLHDTSKIGRMELAISPHNVSWVYIAAEVEVSEDQGGSALYHSQDAGENWERIFVPQRVNWMGNQGWYDNTLAVHPYRDNAVIVGGQGSILQLSIVDSSATDSLLLVDNSNELMPLNEDIIGDDVFPTPVFASFFTGEEPVGPFDYRPVEIRFGPERSQKAHRQVLVQNPFDTFEDLIDVPFEVWDLDNDQQLMVSIADDNQNGVWDLAGLGLGEIIFVHSLPYAPEGDPSLRSFLDQGIYTVIPDFNSEVDPVADFEESSLIIRLEVDSFEGKVADYLPIADGYAEFFSDFPEVGPKGVHVDHHNLILLPQDSTNQQFYILNANDGGIAFSRNSGESFTQTGTTVKGYNTSQFYAVDKKNGESRYIGGTQDNGTWVSPQNPDSTSSWVSAPSGDGFEAIWHYTDGNKLLESSQFNVVYRSVDGGENWEFVRLPRIGVDLGPFRTRLAGSQQDPELVFGISDLGVLRSTDFGLNWEIIEMPEEWVFRGIGNPIEVSIASPQVIWTASKHTDDERIVVSNNGGSSFTPTAAFIDTSMGPVTGFGTHPFEPNTAFALFSFAKAPKILKTTDLGQSWQDISGFGTASESSSGFPDVPVFSLIVMPFDTSRIWVGTDIGLVESTDGGESWELAANGLPPVAIYEMKIVNDEVVVATHGRGIWSVSLPELEGYEPQETLLTPLLALNENALGGVVKGNVNLRSAYDSTQVQVSSFFAMDTVQVTFEANSASETKGIQAFLELTQDSIVDIQVEVSSFSSGLGLTRSQNIKGYPVDSDLKGSYSSDFEQGESDFAREGFVIDSVSGFVGNALQSLHPYPPESELIAVFQKPIRITDEATYVRFDHVALIEPGESENINSSLFYDYAAVEATRDSGQTWTLLDGFDARLHSEWVRAFYNGESPTSELLRPYELDLKDFFETGDTIFLRLRIASDPGLEGWGWLVDNFRVESDSIITSGEITLGIFDVLNTIHANPNPFRDYTTLFYTLRERTTVSIDVYASDGKKVMNLLENQVQFAGEKRYRVENNSLSPGLYLCKIKIGNSQHVLKWLVH